nr:MAG TPA: hypothetical protein [Caudoviricetes sp.]
MNKYNLPKSVRHYCMKDSMRWKWLPPNQT